ncbi:sodium:proton antiporter [Kiloniella laminariae]|uniref:sodium:proton antiporter n=1 Tax=Kiloniella laminariae TaxID=454162 RepID=UPI00037B37ED|nr:sodium:proton antiporter [Kiloniella laminariae]
MALSTSIKRMIMLGLSVLSVLLLPAVAHAAEAGAPHLEGQDMGLIWVLPFAGMLLSIAIFPLVAPNFWHYNFGKISAFWALLFLLPFTYFYGFSLALYETLHVSLLEYFPFIILLFSLFTVAGGVRVRGRLTGTPLLNTCILLIGTLIASWMGTTGAAMLLIRPMIKALQGRKHKTHTIVFFIFLVANIGGSLTPLGDPPLFLGFLKGVDFFWPTTHMLLPMIVLSVILLAVYFVLDSYLYNKEGAAVTIVPDEEEEEDVAFALDGKINLLLLLGVIGAVLLSGFWKPGVSFEIYHVHVELQNLLRDGLLLLIAYLSLYLTNDQSRQANGFNWFPILEVGKLFIGIFITIIPAIAILKAGSEGALGAIVESVTTSDGEPINFMYFWATGILSSFLDNAPTYLVFFNTTGMDVETLMGPASNTLLAISAGAVFMGANTYVGNAPNFMVRSIAEESGIAMPSFFGYMLWSGAILVPCFVLLTFIFFL